MKYDKNTHLLRPLEPGEIIEADDVTIDGRGRLVCGPFPGERSYTPGCHAHYFRPVPITTGWRPRSEAAEAFIGLPKETLIAVQNGDSCATGYPDLALMSPWHAFFVIPPCDIPPPDPERERFEAYIKNSFDSLPDKERYAATKEAFWKVWQAAARKETK